MKVVSESIYLVGAVGFFCTDHWVGGLTCIVFAILNEL